MKTNDWLIVGIIGLTIYGVYVFNKKAVVKMPNEVDDMVDKDAAEEEFDNASGKMKERFRKKKMQLGDLVKKGGLLGAGVLAQRKVVKKVKQKIGKG